MLWLSRNAGLAKASITTLLSYWLSSTIPPWSAWNGGGVCLNISEKLVCKRREDLEQESFELIWVEVYLSPSKKSSSSPCGLLLAGRPPNASTLFYEHLEAILDKVAEWDILFLGDFNAKHRDWFIGDTTNYHGTTLKDLTERFIMSQL